MASSRRILALRDSLDIADARRRFERVGRARLPDVLTGESASAIHDYLVRSGHWNLVCNLGGRHLDTSAAAVARWPEDKQRELVAAIHDQARTGFQYFYAAIPFYDIYHQEALPGDFVNSIFEFLNSDGFLDLARELTGDESISFADGQATRYGPGHFLTSHNDQVDGKRRRAAYVLNLTPDWRTDWGGALQFIGSDGHIEEAWLPRFNVLNVFRVPADHSVGFVAPFAGASRYSITGWLRAGPDPGR